MVAAYLKAHPQFFVEHPAVLAEIAVPHVTGEAVSLVERQVAALREQYRRLENKYRELLAIAAENDDLRRRLHQLTIKLLGSDDIKATIATLYQALMEDFGPTSWRSKCSRRRPAKASRCRSSLAMRPPNGTCSPR